MKNRWFSVKNEKKSRKTGGAPVEMIVVPIGRKPHIGLLQEWFEHTLYNECSKWAVIIYKMLKMNIDYIVVQVETARKWPRCLHGLYNEGAK